MIFAVVSGLLTFTLAGAIHYKALSGAHRLLQGSHLSDGVRLVVALHIAMAAHVLEVALYAVTYLAGAVAKIGGFEKVNDLGWMDAFYFSLVTYTSLGLGDIYPTGHLRFVAGLEALNGFLLISCSASFLFLQMSASRKS